MKLLLNQGLPPDAKGTLGGIPEGHGKMSKKQRGEIVLADRIEPCILLVRGQRVMLDADLAELYGTTTKAINQAVKRNQERFPIDFRFQLTEAEKQEVVTGCDHLARLRFSRTLPYAFTEHGAIMAASVLKRYAVHLVQRGWP